MRGAEEQPREQVVSTGEVRASPEPAAVRCVAQYICNIRVEAARKFNISAVCCKIVKYIFLSR